MIAEAARRLPFVLMVALWLAAPRPARADEIPAPIVGLIAAGVGAGASAAAMELAYAIDDIRMAVRGIHPSRNDGIVELVTSLPVTITAAALTFSLGFPIHASCSVPAGTSCGSSGQIEPVYFVPGLVLTVLSAVLDVHGIWAIATSRAGDARPATARRAPRWTLAPSLSGRGDERSVGLVFAGRF